MNLLVGKTISIGTKYGFGNSRMTSSTHNSTLHVLPLNTTNTVTRSASFCHRLVLR